MKQEKKSVALFSSILNDKELEPPSIVTLPDGAICQSTGLGSELEEQKKIARDGNRSLEERMDAYEDIIDSEVGDTNLVRARNIERHVGLRQVFLKFEGNNPTGTQKDRIAFAQVVDAMRRGYEAITVATCGNYGVAMAFAASLASLRCVVYFPEGYRSRRIQEISRYGAEIIKVPGDYENAVDQSRLRAEKQEIYDANPGGANTMLQLQAYGTIASEIYDELRDAPLAVAVPVSNGTTLAGIYKGFLSLLRRGKTSKMPKLIAGSSFYKNPIIRAFVKKTATCEDLRPQRIRETAINEPLINWHSIDGDYALEAVRSTGGWAEYASDKELLACSRLLREQEGLNVLPASTAGMVALLKQKHNMPADRYVVVLTGRKS